MLAGISAEYYVRLERGNLRGVSQEVLDGIARALPLDEAERAHLHDLARTAAAGAATRRARRRPPAATGVRVRRMMSHRVRRIVSVHPG